MNTPSSNSLLERFYEWEKSNAQDIFMRQPIQGQWHEYSFQKTGNEVRRLASYLKTLALPEGTKIALLSKNCAHWVIADLAIWMAGYVSVPLYPTLTANSIQKILYHSEAKVIFLGKLDDYESQKGGIDSSLLKISFPIYGPNEGILWDDVLKNTPINENIVRRGDDLATISYTSGTTGNPKGVMFTFSAMWNGSVIPFESIFRELHFAPRPRLFSYLPLSHIAERMIVEAGALYCGAQISFVETLETFGKNLSETQPHLFFGVPRIWARFQEKLWEKIPEKKLKILLGIPLVNALLKKKIKKNLGLTYAICASGAAPIPVSLLKWYESLGIVIREIYGMTENSGVSHFNLTQIKFGTVGKPWPDVRVKISEEGEIQTWHKGMTSGYYKDSALTKELFTDDGYVRTGDKGVVDAEGFTNITGRIKDIFKTDKGKYVAPGPIETQLLVNPDIEQACVVGMGIPQPIALIGLSAAGKSKVKESIIKSLSDSLHHVNQTLESYEKLEAFVIMKENWTVENGLLTPTLKVKRNEVEKIHLPKYPEWYRQKGPVVWE